MTSRWMLYGANGYTGRLIVAEAQARGLSPVLAGRNRAAIEALASETGLEHCVFDLDDDFVKVRVSKRLIGPFVAETDLSAVLVNVSRGQAVVEYLGLTAEQQLDGVRRGRVAPVVHLEVGGPLAGLEARGVGGPRQVDGARGQLVDQVAEIPGDIDRARRSDLHFESLAVDPHRVALDGAAGRRGGPGAGRCP